MKVVLIIFQLLVGLNLIVWFNYIGLSFYLILAYKQKLGPGCLLFFLIILTFPIILGISFYKAWDLIENLHYLPAFLISIIPLIAIFTAYALTKFSKNILNASNLYRKLP